ncbi:MAG: Asp-tRNA(Asn)/Glu-tRNA(Gln) amidotransferase subunit GatC [Deltaproteobacteria bacterium]|jgi:aspartyl-tRNA(Asn)/glutamyl-tRNA(Gln) amidotransferase subunit C|nr:Asp-tRNA(Asn)/Glu-tRNA(Gln) amidotransferase subunit GatC [Deltaproteobacteria bacterium]
MYITQETVRHIAKLSALELSDEEVKKAQQQIGEIINYMDILSKVDTTDVEPTLHIHNAINAFSEDIILEALPVEKIKAMAPEFQDGYFKVPKFINN